MKKLMIILALVSVISACKKSDATIETPDGGGKYLKKINYWTVASNTEVTVRELVVDASGNLTAVRTYTTAAQGGTSGQLITEYTSVEKDASGKITKLSGQDKMQNKTLVFEFTYDANGNLTKALLKQNGADYRTVNYTYDSSNRLLTETELASNNNNQVVLVKTFTYSGTSLNPSGYTSDQKLYNQVTTYTLKFDDKKNPSQAAPKIFYAIGFGDFYVNNVVESTTGGVTTKSTLTYNAAGFATSTTNGSGSGLKFVYAD